MKAPEEENLDVFGHPTMVSFEISVISFSTEVMVLEAPDNISTRNQTALFNSNTFCPCTSSGLHGIQVVFRRDTQELLLDTNL